jgi:hypothetical protein
MTDTIHINITSFTLSTPEFEVGDTVRKKSTEDIYIITGYNNKFALYSIASGARYASDDYSLNAAFGYAGPDAFEKVSVEYGQVKVIPSEPELAVGQYFIDTSRYGLNKVYIISDSGNSRNPYNLINIATGKTYSGNKEHIQDVFGFDRKDFKYIPESQIKIQIG